MIFLHKINLVLRAKEVQPSLNLKHYFLKPKLSVNMMTLRMLFLPSQNYKNALADRSE